jgi:hypothetical protein
MPRYPATKVPPSCENVSIELAKRVLAESWGNIARAADALGIPSKDFRFLVRTTPALAAVADEAGELFCDRAESILRDALESENELRRDVAARFVLSGKGAPRGWTRPLSPAVTIEQQQPRQVVIKWLDEDESSACAVSEGSPPLIDARPVAGDDRGSGQTLQRSFSPEDVGDLGRCPFEAREMDVIERNGKNISVPRYSSGRGVDCVEGEAATPAVLIEHQETAVREPVASTPTLPVWTGPYPPPPLVAHLYAPYAPPQLDLPPQPGLRMSVPSRGRAVRR